MVRWREIEDDERLETAHPLLKAAVAHIAHYQIRNRGTVGGSLAHADPAAEMPGIAITCDAEIAVVGKAGARVIQAADFFQGALTTALTADEIIIEVRLPAWPRERRWGFDEFARRRGDFAMAAAAIGRLPAPSFAADRHPCRLRARRVRRLHGYRRWRGRALLPHARRAGRGRRGRNRRRAIQRRRPHAAAKIISQASRPAMRLLHARHDHDGARAVERGA